MKKPLTAGMIRKAVMALKLAEQRRKPVKYYKMEVKNFELFEKMKKAGKLKQVRPGGAWDLVE